MLKQTIHDNTTEAMKKGDKLVTDTLRMLLASIVTKEKENRYKISKEHPDFAEDKLAKESELTDEQILEVVSVEIKKRKDAIALYEQGNRPELAEKEKKEIDILIKYLPEQLSPEALKELVIESIKLTGATEMKDMGKIMADLAPKIKGKADGGEVSKIVKELLTK
ncbi:MAG: GatB/YqeY domain-containing protein [Candidatus Staskawiczbacteria bacterium]|jgi:hypothetical protein